MGKRKRRSKKTKVAENMREEGENARRNKCTSKKNKIKRRKIIDNTRINGREMAKKCRVK